PCEGLACGDPCYQNFPSGSDPAGEAQYMTCDRYGDCVYGIAQCEAECEGPEDCALPEICIPCAGGSCAEGACQAGLCTTVCPSGRQPCTDASDCPQPPPICIACPAGGCQGVSCIENECRMTCATDGQCLENLDCPACETCFTPTDNADVACWPSSCQFGRCYTPCN
ncbi:MAG TPA: hypothetical protein VGK73_34195, partial [Polyangiaceae bacterium]